MDVVRSTAEGLRAGDLLGSGDVMDVPCMDVFRVAGGAMSVL